MLQLLTSALRSTGPNLIDAVLGQLNTTLISPKNLPSPIVSNIIGSSCSETTSTVPWWIKYIYKYNILSYINKLLMSLA